MPYGPLLLRLIPALVVGCVAVCLAAGAFAARGDQRLQGPGTVCGAAGTKPAVAASPMLG